MIIPDQIFLSFIISFSSTSRDEQKQTQFVSQVCGWEKIIKHEICSYQFSCRIQPYMKFISVKNMALHSVFEQIFLLYEKSYKQTDINIQVSQIIAKWLFRLTYNYASSSIELTEVTLTILEKWHKK